MKLIIICLIMCFMFTVHSQDIEDNQFGQDIEDNQLEPVGGFGAPELPKRSGHLAGGYTAQDVNDPEIIEVANKAIEILKKETSDIELVKIISAATQVVAGLNYRLVLEVKTNNQIEKWTLVLYRRFDNTYTLTSCKK